MLYIYICFCSSSKSLFIVLKPLNVGYFFQVFPIIQIAHFIRFNWVIYIWGIHILVWGYRSSPVIVKISGFDEFVTAAIVFLRNFCPPKHFVYRNLLLLGKAKGDVKHDFVGKYFSRSDKNLWGCRKLFLQNLCSIR